MNAPTLTELAHAKVNLFLEVTGKRPDGYHELDTVMHEIDLSDRVHLTPAEAGVRLQVDVEGLSVGEDNLAIRAVRAVERYIGRSLPCDIRIEKRIPAGGGLGGGSSDAAAVIRLLNRAFELGLDVGAMESIAATFGSDISFFIRGGTALCTGRGEIIEPIRLDRSLDFLLVLPGVACPTPVIFKRLQLTDEKTSSYDLRQFLHGGSVADLRKRLFNRLEQSARTLFPVIEDWLTRLAAHHAVMSGSGSTIFVLCDDDAHARSLRSSIDVMDGAEIRTAATAWR